MMHHHDSPCRIISRGHNRNGTVARCFQFLGFLTAPHPYITDTYEIPDCAPVYSIGGTKVSLIQSSRLSAIQRLIIEYLMTPIQQTLINLSARLSTATLESMMLD